MREPLRVLFLGGNAEDEGTVLPELQRGGRTVVLVRALPFAFRSALAEPWDVVLAPPTSAINVLTALHAEGIDLPVLVLCTPDEEQAALTALDAGAADYVLRTDLRRLGPAVRRQLPRRATQRAEEEVRRLNQELERRVADRTAQLAAANQELEAFCYSVSHDLRAPLRAIDGFSKTLLEDCADRLGADGTDHLKRVRAATRRMSELIDDLLILSRVTRAEMHQRKVDLTALAEPVVANLRHGNPGRDVSCTIAPGLAATGDANLLRLVLENLLGNAWKYTAKKGTAHVELGTLPVEEGTAFFVRDDGAGFDPAYAHKLFQPFQRLHRPDEFEGHGIGLATVQRIVRRHGGHVWAQGQVGQGATFFFSLPSAGRGKDGSGGVPCETA